MNSWMLRLEQRSSWIRLRPCTPRRRQSFPEGPSIAQTFAPRAVKYRQRFAPMKPQAPATMIASPCDTCSAEARFVVTRVTNRGNEARRGTESYRRLPVETRRIPDALRSRIVEAILPCGARNQNEIGSMRPSARALLRDTIHGDG